MKCIIQKSVLWISEITSSPKPIQYKQNRTYSSAEVSSLQFYPALQLLHSSKEPWQKLHFLWGIHLDWYSWWTIHPAKPIGEFQQNILMFRKEVFHDINCLALVHFCILYIVFPFTNVDTGETHRITWHHSKLQTLAWSYWFPWVSLDWKFLNSNLTCFWFFRKNTTKTPHLVTNMLHDNWGRTFST